MLSWARALWAERQRRRRLPPKPIRVLRLLEAEGAPVKGWDIIERAELRLGFAIGYTTLREMTEEGSIVVEQRPDVLGVRGGRPAFYYAITDQGRERLAAFERQATVAA